MRCAWQVEPQANNEPIQAGTMTRDEVKMTKAWMQSQNLFELDSGNSSFSPTSTSTPNQLSAREHHGHVDSI